MLAWVTLDETIGDKTYTYCLMKDGKGMEAMAGSKTEVLNVPANCIFNDVQKAKQTIDDYALGLHELGLLKRFKIQMQVYGY